ncbi:mitochondrial 54S ribosomal protein mL43 [Dipodascopsis tothii]|uniref:mitochondrial 54S ribosomal protein mL43 n=1 Tax=Dipodascopsis tothii TaxID=44089 RepID=UPI0034CF998D
MTVQAVRRGLSVSRNGVGSFIQQCKRVTFQYCNNGASSRGMREYLNKSLQEFAAANKNVEVKVQVKAGHPIIRGEYINGREKVICVRNMTPHEIGTKATIVKDSSGNKMRRMKNPVASNNPSVRGIWSPFHILAPFRHRV